MIGFEVRIGKFNIHYNPAIALYFIAAIASVVTLLIIRPLMQITSENWAEYYRAIGQLLRIWGIIFGISFIAVFVFFILREILTASLDSFIIRLTSIEKILVLLFLCNLIWGGIGILRGSDTSYVIGDTLRGSFIPGIYWIVKKSINSIRSVIYFVKAIITIETLLLILLVFLEFIPFSFAGRTFLTTIYFTLLFEEKDNTYQILYAILILFGIYTILTTAAVRGIIIIFIIIIISNFIFRLREIKLNILIFAFVIPSLGLLTANEFLDLNLEKDVEKTTSRFEQSIGEAGRNRYFGLDESLFQRVGETIDVGRAFQANSPIYLITGFGNGAELTNFLMTPSEKWVFKTNKKHNIYITPVAILYRNGFIGILLYLFIAIYILRILSLIRINRKYLKIFDEIVILKVLCLYQISMILGGLVAFSYIGNIIVAFTLALIEPLRIFMVNRINEKPISLTNQ